MMKQRGPVPQPDDSLLPRTDSDRPTLGQGRSRLVGAQHVPETFSRLPAAVVRAGLLAWTLLASVSMGATAPAGGAPVAPAPGRADSSDTVLAQVNDEPITAFQVDQFLLLKLLDQEFTRKATGLTTEERENYVQKSRRETLDQLIDQRLILQEAKKQEETQPLLKEEVDYFLKQHMKKLEDELGMATLERELSRRNKSIRDYRKEQRETILQQRFLYNTLFSKLSVGPAEILGYYQDHPAEFSAKLPLTYRQIWFHSVDFGTEEKAREAAEDAIRKLAAGEDFAALWKQCSYDRDSARYPGGLRSYPDFSAISKDLADVLSGMEPGAVSKPMAYEGGFRVLKLEQKPGTKTTPFAAVQDQIENTLMSRKRAAAREQYVIGLRKKAFIRYFQADDTAQKTSP